MRNGSGLPRASSSVNVGWPFNTQTLLPRCVTATTTGFCPVAGEIWASCGIASRNGPQLLVLVACACAAPAQSTAPAVHSVLRIVGEQRAHERIERLAVATGERDRRQ